MFNTIIEIDQNTTTVSSLLIETRDCLYEEGECLIFDGSLFKWNIKKHIKKALCKYIPLKNFLIAKIHENTLISTDRQIALLFSTKLLKKLSCNIWLVVTQQGFALEEKEYFLKLKNRTKREDVVVTSSQLAAQLTTSQLASAKILDLLMTKFCIHEKYMHQMYRLRNAIDATLLARELLNKFAI